MATLCGFDVTSHPSDAELKDESGDRIESELRDEQLFPYIEYDDLKSDVRRKKFRTRAATVQYSLSVYALSFLFLLTLSVPTLRRLISNIR